MKEAWRELKQLYQQFAKAVVDAEDAGLKYERTHTWEAHNEQREQEKTRDKIAETARKQSQWLQACPHIPTHRRQSYRQSTENHQPLLCHRHPDHTLRHSLHHHDSSRSDLQTTKSREYQPGRHQSPANTPKTKESLAESAARG